MKDVTCGPIVWLRLMFVNFFSLCTAEIEFTPLGASPDPVK